MTEEILFLERDGWGEIVLNAPRRLNALSKAMCEAMAERMDCWRDDDAIRAVMIKGAGDRAFCAGGDIRALYAARKEGDIAGPLGFFEAEYRNNWRMAHFPKPIVALIDGIVMGGGVGVSVHGRYRVATERAQFAMPECGIGLYPDVGATHVLPGLPGESGMWLALTGARIGWGDMLGLGLATHAVESNRLHDLEAALRRADWLDGPFEAVETVLDDFHEVPQAEIPAVDARREITAIFRLESVAEIMDALERLDTDWGRAQAAAIRGGAPLSLKVTHRAQRAGREMTIAQALDFEYAVTRRFIEEGAFMEGVRAQVIDKDRNPQWSPATLDDVDDGFLNSMFQRPEDAPVFGWED